MSGTVTLDQWLLAMNAGQPEDPTAQRVIRMSPALHNAIRRASDGHELPAAYYEGAPRYGNAEAVIDYDYPPGGWCLLTEGEAEVISGGVLDPCEFSPPPAHILEGALLGVCQGCGGRYTYGHECR